MYTQNMHAAKPRYDIPYVTLQNSTSDIASAINTSMPVLRQFNVCVGATAPPLPFPAMPAALDALPVPFWAEDFESVFFVEPADPDRVQFTFCEADPA